jgi:hypothetical protein
MPAAVVGRRAVDPVRADLANRPADLARLHVERLDLSRPQLLRHDVQRVGAARPHELAAADVLVRAARLGRHVNREAVRLGVVDDHGPVRSLEREMAGVGVGAERRRVADVRERRLCRSPGDRDEQEEEQNEDHPWRKHAHRPHGALLGHSAPCHPSRQ